jgi:hypothetical protein
MYIQISIPLENILNCLALLKIHIEFADEATKYKEFELCVAVRKIFCRRNIQNLFALFG